MAMNFEEVLQAAVVLPVQERERLIDELIVSCAAEDRMPLDEMLLSQIQIGSVEKVKPRRRS